MNSKETFISLIESFASHHDMANVFDDFLTFAIGILGNNPLVHIRSDRSSYHKIMEKYSDPIKSNFAKMLTCLTREMTEGHLSNEGNDILGDFYDSRLRKSSGPKSFIPYSDCALMARSAISEAKKDFSGKSLHIVDFACGSGRILVSASKESNNKHHYFGIDTHHTFVKMAALNLFLNGAFSSEVMCKDGDDISDFKVSYIVSSLPFGIFQIDEKEKSFLWKLLSKHRKVPDLFRVRKESLN